MKVLIVEDEPMAQKALAHALTSRYPDLQIVGTTDSVAGTLAWLQDHSDNGAGMHGGWAPERGVDIIFMDVELSDGNCFEIFRQAEISAKVIMTTAYDSYAIKAFEAGSLDYLLKPIDPADLDRAVKRALSSLQTPSDVAAALRAMEQGRSGGGSGKERFIVRLGDKIVPVKVEDIAYFYSEEKSNFLCTKSGSRYIVDSSLDIIADELPAKSFFRISRGCIVNIHSIESIMRQPSGRLVVLSTPPADFEMAVSRARVDDFMSWLSA